MLDVGTRVVSLEPTTLEEVFATIELVGRLTDRTAPATALVASLRARVAVVQDGIPDRTPRPRVWVCEWLEPPYSAGHWVSAQVEAAGGQEVFHRVGLPSTRVAPEAVVDRAPEIIVLAPCGFHVDDVEREARRVTLFPGWEDLPAVKSGAVWAVDASSYYSRPGPRLVDGTELLARILHPEISQGAPRDGAVPAGTRQPRGGSRTGRDVTVACGAPWRPRSESRLAGAIGARGTARWASLIAATDTSPSGPPGQPRGVRLRSVRRSPMHIVSRPS
jgi:Periplasmic binding protein